MKVYIFGSKIPVDYDTFIESRKDKSCTFCKHHYVDYPFCTKRLGCSGYSEFDRITQQDEKK